MLKKSDIFRKRKKRNDGGMVEERSRPHHPRERERGERERREHKTHLNWHCNGRLTKRGNGRERGMTPLSIQSSMGVDLMFNFERNIMLKLFRSQRGRNVPEQQREERSGARGQNEKSGKRMVEKLK